MLANLPTLKLEIHFFFFYFLCLRFEMRFFDSIICLCSGLGFIFLRFYQWLQSDLKSFFVFF